MAFSETVSILDGRLKWLQEMILYPHVQLFELKDTGAIYPYYKNGELTGDYGFTVIFTDQEKYEYPSLGPALPSAGEVKVLDNGDVMVGAKIGTFDQASVENALVFAISAGLAVWKKSQA